MARLARVVVPDYPHHVTQRGNRRQQTFFSDDDYRAYLELIEEAKKDANVAIWAYCLMPNHVHLVVVPRDADGLASLCRSAHRRYARRVNLREGWRGHLWQERFHSSVMDERYLLAAVRYVERNPVRARLCQRPEDWRWSSARAHLHGGNDPVVDVAPMLDRIDDWRTYLAGSDAVTTLDAIRRHSRTGWPVGDAAFVACLEGLTGRRLRKRAPGRKARK